MIDVVHVEEDVVQFRTRRRGWPSSCNVYLVRDGDRAIMIDAGLGVEPDLGSLCVAAGEALSGWGQDLRDVHLIILTHTHTDHAGGAVPLARRTGARVLLPARGWAQAADPQWQVHHILPPDVDRELAGVFDVAQHFRDDAMPELFSDAPDVAFETVEDGDERRVGRYRLRAHHLPGHDVAHLAWVDAARGLGFTGDMLAARGTSLPWYPPNAGGVAGYVDSVERLRALGLGVACPGHHAVIRGHDAVATLAEATLAKVHERSHAIVRRLLQGTAMFAELDDLVYTADVRAVIPWASSVTMAHLRYLETAGLVRRDAAGRFLTESAAATRYLARHGGGKD